MADSRRLENAIAGVHYERRTLVFIDHLHPSRSAENHLKPHAVIVHVIRHRTAVRDANVRSDEAAAEAAGDQVAILHGRAPCSPGAGAAPSFWSGYDELLLAFGDFNRRIGVYELDLDAAWDF